MVLIQEVQSDLFFSISTRATRWALINTMNCADKPSNLCPLNVLALVGPRSDPIIIFLRKLAQTVHQGKKLSNFHFSSIFFLFRLKSYKSKFAQTYQCNCWRKQKLLYISSKRTRKPF